MQRCHMTNRKINGQANSRNNSSRIVIQPRWKGIRRDYTKVDVQKLQGSVQIEHTLAKLGAKKLWEDLHKKPYLHALGAMTGNQAVQQVQAGLPSIYVSGWQVAADANLSDTIYPDQSLYPSNSVPTVVRKINRALLRADQIHVQNGKKKKDWIVPIVADAEAGFGGPLNTYELMQQMIEAGAAAVHFEDQLASAKKCGHMGGKVLVPTSEFITKLKAARLASDVCRVPTLIIARTDANGARLLTCDIDPRDQLFIKSGKRTSEGFYHIQSGLDSAIERSLAYAPYADMLWCETSQPDLTEAQEFADAIHSSFPGKLLCYNCSPSFNWKKSLSTTQIKKFQRELSKMGYRFQFITLAGFHSLNLSMYELAKAYQEEDMLAYSKLQQREFKRSHDAEYQATTHQKFVGAGYFDQITQIVGGGESEIVALKGSTEEKQFHKRKKAK